MIYRKPDYYDSFRCIADKCPENCCRLWQIVIDEESLTKYAEEKGELEALLTAGIDWEEGCFLQKNRSCSMLLPNGLCILQANKGEEYLCDTCHRYPRHTEEFENERELSLSLSCPEAARIILSQKGYINIVETEDNEEETDENFDAILYSLLLDARKLVLSIAENRSLAFEKRLDIILLLGKQFQECIDDNDFFRIDELISDFDLKSYTDIPSETRDEAAKYYSGLYELEMLHDNWHDILEACRYKIFVQDGFSKYLSFDDDLSGYAENCLKFFIFTYFCGAVYDDMLYSKLALSVYSTKWICMLSYSSEDTDKKHSFLKASYSLAREIEHSDENLLALDDFFDSMMTV